MRRTKYVDEEEKYFPIRPFQLWVILVCGIIVTLIGVYFIIEGEVLTGKAFSNGRMGPRAGSLIILSGPILTFIGLAKCIFPIYHLVKQSKKTKNVG